MEALFQSAAESAGALTLPLMEYSSDTDPSGDTTAGAASGRVSGMLSALLICSCNSLLVLPGMLS